MDRLYRKAQGFRKKSNPVKLAGSQDADNHRRTRRWMLMKHKPIAVLAAVLLLPAAPQDLSAQRLLDEWRVRLTAGPEALAGGAAAVFWNPAQVTAASRGEATVADLRAPGITGVDGLAASLAWVLDGRTTLGIGYEYMGVGGMEGTTTSPDAGAPLDIGENRFALAASHTLSPRTRIGAAVQYTRLPAVATESRSISLGGGVHLTPSARIPLSLAGSAAVEGDAVSWLGGVEFTSGERWTAWQLRAQYGAAGSDLEPGTTHRLVAVGEWRGHVELSAGAVSEPDGAGRAVHPVGGAELRLYRYRLGMVREQLGNDFGGAWSFRFTVGF
jgi:hypothetical protein